MPASPPAVLLVKTAPEITTKSAYVRAKFTNRAELNARAALKSAGARKVSLTRAPGRLFFTGVSAKSAKALSKTFGLHAYAHAKSLGPASVDEIAEAAAALSKKWKGAKTFAVRARRSNRSGFTSKDLEVACGASILEKNPRLKVNLSDPQKTLYVEAYANATYLYDQAHPCPGGLPAGVSGKVGVLFEKGSKAEENCAKMMLKRGCVVRAVIAKKTPAIQKRLRALAPWSAGSPLLPVSPEKARRTCAALARADTALSPKSARDFADFDARAGALVLRPLLLAPKEVVP